MIYFIIAAIILGTALLVLECFLPGIGIAGISGGILSVLGVLGLASYIGWYIILVILAIVLVVLLSIFCFAKTAQKGKNPLILSQRTDKESGFSANDDNRGLVNQTGITVTPLRPAGIAIIDNKRVDVVTNGEFVNKDVKIRVCEIQGRRIIVKEEV